MKLTGVEVPAETLFKLEPNTFLAVISDKDGDIRVIKVEVHNTAHNVPANTVLSVEEANSPTPHTVLNTTRAISSTPYGASRSSCLKYRDGEMIWVPC